MARGQQGARLTRLLEVPGLRVAWRLLNCLMQHAQHILMVLPLHWTAASVAAPDRLVLSRLVAVLRTKSVAKVGWFPSSFGTVTAAPQPPSDAG